MAEATVPRVDERPRYDNRVFVGGFPEGTDMAAVQAHLAPSGTITNFKVKTKQRRLEETTDTVENGFVTFESAEGAEACIAQFNGQAFNGTVMRVEYQIKRKNTRKKKAKKPVAEG